MLFYVICRIDKNVIFNLKYSYKQ